jgi:Site-specific DNA methylase
MILGLPYMGSKNKIAPIIFKIIDEREKNKKLFDMFCGGGAIAYYFSLKGWQVLANDIDTALINFHKEIIKGIPQNIKDKFFTREEFVEGIKKDDWLCGFLKCFWSFGNNKRSYIYGKNIENDKHRMHDAVFADKPDAAKELLKEFQTEISLQALFNWQKLKLLHRFRLLARCFGSRKETQHLERLQHLQHLERLERLERKDVEFSNKDFKDVLVEDRVVYCDPPYINTEGYGVKFNHDKFYDYVLSLKNPVYVSEFSMPDKYKKFFEEKNIFLRRNGATALVNNKMEKLFIKKQ